MHAHLVHAHLVKNSWYMGVPVNMVNCTVKHAVKLVGRGPTLVPTVNHCSESYTVRS